MKAWVIVIASFKACGIALAAEHHAGAGAILFFAPDPWVFLQFFLPSAQGFGPAITSFETERREVWLTIDDGPDPSSTPRVLDLLRKHGARATFFVIGEQVARHPELARRIESGSVGVNYAAMTMEAPFGGYKQSGLGKELGPEGLDAYLNTKTIYRPGA